MTEPPTNRTKARVTMADVAKAASVSKALVSRILNKVGSQIPIPEETIRRIERIALEMNYVPLRSARSLKRGTRLNLVGFSTRAGIPPGVVHTPEELLTFAPLPDEYRHPAIEEAMTYERNFTIGMLLDALGSVVDITSWDLMIHHRNEGQNGPLQGADLSLDLVDGLLYFQPTTVRTEYINFARAGYPIVVIGHISGVDPGICAVGIDNLKASTQVVRHLVGLGRRNLASLWPYGEYVLLSKGRAEGYLEALTTLASPTMPICGVSYFCGPELTSARGYWMTHRILKDQPALDALIVGTDSMVRGAIYAIQESGRRVPEDVSVVTFDDKPINIIESPSITALRIPFLEIYRQATQLLVDLIQGRITEPQHIELEPELIIRESCGGELPK